MPLITHGNLKQNNGIHIAYSFSYADSTARTAATGFVAGDAGKFALQNNDKSIWMLTVHSPATWKLISLEAHAHVISDITNLQDTLDGKSAVGHDHVISDITGLATAISDLQGVNSSQDSAISAKAPINSPTFTGTVSGITKAMVGLGNVDNTSDTDKPISSAAQTALNGKIATTAKGAADGVCPLDSGAKVAETYLPDSILGQVNYQGVWSASANSPAIPAAVAGNKGHYRICTTGVASNHGYSNVPAIDFQVGDWIISDGAAWNKVDNTDAISSFNGRTGAISPVAGDYSAFYEGTITTLPVNKGGTGVQTLTGLVKASGTSAFSAAVAGTDYVIPGGTVANATNATTAAACSGNAATATTATTATTAYKIRTSAPGTPTDGDIWMV
jgi:hypothetical protein